MQRTFSIATLLLTIACVAWITGCGDKNNKTQKQAKRAVKKHIHNDHEEGPHGGHIIELGGVHHAEVTHDDDAQLVTVYLLGGDVKTPVSSAEKELAVNLTVGGQPKQFKLAAAPQQGDAEGQSSKYELKDAALLEALEAASTKGRLQVTIDGKSYSGDIEGHAH
jgi:hypothetical protein